MSSYRKTPPVLVEDTFEILDLSKDEVWVLFYALSVYDDSYNSTARRAAHTKLLNLVDHMTDDIT